MPLVLRALKGPVTVVVAVIALVVGAVLALRGAPVDIFPPLGVPVIYVVQPYGGMSPSQMEGQLVTYYEYHFLYIAGIEHIESQSIQGMAMLKLYFHPGTDIAQSMSQVVAMAFRATSFMPPGTLPAFIVRFDAGSIPVGQLVFSSPNRSDSEIQDLALYRVRPLLATLPGVSAPPPSGGKIRTIVVYVDPDRMRSYGMSPDDIAGALGRENLTLPAGNVRVGDLTTIADTNAMVLDPSELGNIPLRASGGATVHVRDLARVEDGADVVYNIALVNGRRTVYMPVTKRADASTLDVVNAVKAALPQMRALVPEDIKIDLDFDQSVYVKNAVSGLTLEGVLGAILTALTVLAFLKSWRSASIIVLTIPFSLLAAVIALRLAGQTVNIMTLGGLALAVGILVDEGTVAVENIHSHLARGQRSARAVVDAMREVMFPRFLAMLCVVAVFIPALFMVGIGRALFPPLALAVAFAMIASYLLSSTLVPVLAVTLFRGHEQGAVHADPAWFQRLQEGYARVRERTARARPLVLGIYALSCVLLVGLGGLLARELFPRVDTGQFQIRVRAPAGTRLERTEDLVKQVDQAVREEVGPGKVDITLANIGNPPWSYPVNGIYVWNAGPQEAILLVALRKGGRPSLERIEESLRAKLAARFPGVRFSFEAGDVVSQVLNFGAAAPIQVTVAGNALKTTRAFAEKVQAALAAIPRLRDVQIPLALDYPTLDIDIDRERAAQYGVTVDRVGRSIVAATSSSVLVSPNFWVSPATGIPYRVAVRVPEQEVRSPEDVLSLPVMPDGAPRPLVRDLASVEPGKTYGEIDHWNSQRTITVTGNVAGGDLGRADVEVAKAIAGLGEPPRGTSVKVRGQVEQMRLTLESLRTGLLLAALVVVLLLAANFQSFREPLLVLAMLPAVVGGALLVLAATGTTINVQSLLGMIMAVGVSVANAVLLLTFARERRRAGDDPATAVSRAATARMRPILMTTLAMVAGMIPMALGLGEGGDQNSPLARSVIGGLAFSTLAVLLVLPLLYAWFIRGGTYRTASLDPDDPEGLTFERPA